MNEDKQAPNDFVRISAELFEAPKLADLFDENGSDVFLVWIYLIVRAKRAKRLGRIIAPPVRVARAIGITTQKAEAIIAGLVAKRSLVAIDDGGEHHFQIRNWHRWQSMSPAERARKYRETASRENDTPSRENDTPSPDKTRPNTTRPNTTPQKKGRAKSKYTAEQRAEQQAVFDHWRSLEWKGRSASKRSVLNDDRRSRINARRAEGFTVEDLCNALTGYANDPFWNGTQDGRAQMEIKFRLGDAANVERGLERFSQQAQRKPASSYMKVAGNV